MQASRSRFIPCCLLAALMLMADIATVDASWFESAAHWLSPELRSLENRENALEQTMAALPPAPATHLTERMGFHSAYWPAADTEQWVELDLCQEAPIHSVVLVAAPSNSGGSAPAGYGFPVRFRVELASALNDDERFVIADFTAEDFPNPGALPVFLPAHGRKGRVVRVTARRLFCEGKRHLLALGELMIFQGRRNLAANARVTQMKAQNSTGAIPVWGKINLVDGHVATGPPVGAQPSPTLGYRSKAWNERAEPVPHPRWVQVDLGLPLSVAEVCVFPAHPPEFAHRPGFGYPASCKVELSNDAEFREAITVRSFDQGNPLGSNDPANPGDNMVTFTTRGETARYARFTGEGLFNANGQHILALAEMQIWSGGKNVALGRPVSAFDFVESEGWSPQALVDGFNSSANILDWPEWLEGLSQRREAMHLLATLDTQRAKALARFKTIGWWLLGCVVGGVLLLLSGFILHQRLARRRELEALRQRIAQDLHDEIGSGLGSICLASQGALRTTHDEETLRELADIRNTAQQTLDSMRDLVRLTQSGKYGQGDLTAHLREIAQRALHGIPYTLNDRATAAFNRLPMDQRRDLLLMFKETLHNLARHAKATEASITLAQSNGMLTLTVRDNGCGFDPAASADAGTGLTNLQHRAAKHHGSFRIQSAPAQGTIVTISLPYRV